MQKFFFNKKLVVTLIGLIVSFLLIAFSISVRNNRSMPPFIVQFGNEAAGVVNTVVSYPVNGVAKVGSNVSDLLNTYEENQSLKSIRQTAKLNFYRPKMIMPIVLPSN